MADWHYFHIASQATFVVAPPNSTLICVTVNKGAASAAVTVFDGNNTTTTGLSTVGIIDASAAGNFFYGHTQRAGITVTQATGSADLTVIYQLPDEAGDIEYSYGQTEGS
jgi:hypothetical protein